MSVLLRKQTNKQTNKNKQKQTNKQKTGSDHLGPMVPIGYAGSVISLPPLSCLKLYCSLNQNEGLIKVANFQRQKHIITVMEQ